MAQKHRRTVTRFCDEAGLEDLDQVDLAEFIVAARYLGTNATDDQLMETFLEMESGEISAASAKDKLKELITHVQDKYGADEDTADPAYDHEVLKNKIVEEDAEWQEVHLDAFIREAGVDSKLEIAKNLMLTTSLTPHQVAGITGIDVALLDDLESDGDESDGDNEDSVTQTVASATDTKGAVTVQADEFNKAVVITQSEIAGLDNILAGGNDSIKQETEMVLVLLRKFHASLNLTPVAHRRVKTLRKMVSTNTIHSAAVPSSNSGKFDKQLSTDQLEYKDTDGNKNLKPEVFPRKFRVVIHPGALVKSEEKLDSKEVAKIPIGTVVVVSEIVGRRACLIDPVKGWCSIISKDGRIILQKESTNSPEMAKAVHAARSRQTKILILKSITTLEDTTVKRILEKSDWNLRRAIEAFYIAKYKTAEYLKNQEGPGNNKQKGNLRAGLGGSKKRRKKGWWGKWKGFVKANQGELR